MEVRESGYGVQERLAAQCVRWRKRGSRSARLLVVLAVVPLGGSAQLPSPVSVPTLHLTEPSNLPRYGPYNAHLLAGGRGLTKPLPPGDPLLESGAAWTLSAWIEIAPVSPATVAIAGAGEATGTNSRMFGLVDGSPSLRLGETDVLRSTASFARTGWHLFAATSDGERVDFYVDGVRAASGPALAGVIAPRLVMGPVKAACAKLPCPHFGGKIAQLTLARGSASAAAMQAMAAERPDPDLIAFEEGSKPWPLQVVQFAGNTAPQEPWTMPQRHAPFSKPQAATLPPAETTLTGVAPGDWVLRGGWKLAAAPEVPATAQAISTAGFDTSGWMAATVPGTVLTTMVDRGIYPNPDYGLNNLAIPEKLSRQAYWYRAEFATPLLEHQPRLSLRLDGINYHAEVWLNGERLGEMTGAFTRGTFEVSRSLHAQGRNALAIRIAPVPHPGLPNVQSIALGSGLNGGAMELDGPTFLASEGWDWNPPMHDRDTGLWQEVHLLAGGPVAIGDQQVITQLALPDITQADVTLAVPLSNDQAQAVTGTLQASFEGVTLHKQVTVPPGGITVQLAPAEFAALHLHHPRLWWPNGYGSPELYHLTTIFVTEGAAPVEKKLTFGVREVTYDLSLLDNQGALRRVEYDPTVGREEPKPQVDVTHEGLRQVPGGWAASIAAGEDASAAFRAVDDTRATPFLTIRVNGVRIAVRGGSWGMDDSRKRVSRERLEPFFRYNREANLNMIRNWEGQNTEETFFDLADEYGLLVWNDFWEVTTDSNAEAEDPQLFLANARDTILRARNHPSIVMWCGRNEGVPQPILNQGLIALTHSLDGTRYYSPSSNEVNLLPSGPYSYQEPAEYSRTLDRGFAVEVGTSSLPTLEWFERWMPKEDRWPISDDWAYHNWHPLDAFRDHREAQFGVAASLEEYERQAQMMNYVDYLAIFEGFNAHLWAPNTGRLLWMTQPSWPSMLWGILSSDYDTQASFYATKKACEPVHVQLDLPSGDVQVINTTLQQLVQGRVDTDVYALDGALLLHRETTLDAASDEVTAALHLELASLMGDTTVLTKLTLRDRAGALLSENLYWRANTDAGYRALTTLGKARVELATHPLPPGARGERRSEVEVRNQSRVAALNTKLSIFRSAGGAEVLPAFYSDNYISLLPGERRTVTLEMPEVEVKEGLTVKVRGWNVIETSISLHLTK